MAGVLEIFFGPVWGKKQRLSYAPFLASIGFDSYLYGPKADSFLRKRWADKWPADYTRELGEMAAHFRGHGVKFGVILSPFGAQEKFGPEERRRIIDKVKIFNEVGIDTVGLFFDDMPSSENLAERQLEVLGEVVEVADSEILFCPSYYSDDPILDKVFGQRPPGYLETLGRQVPEGVKIAWTGPKVISDVVPSEHLTGVARVLRRKPFLCDNVFANDGPKNCKFLRLQPLQGRDPECLSLSSGWSFNPMNQAELSKLALVSAAKAMGGIEPGAALNAAIREQCSPALVKFLERHRESFLKPIGLENIDTKALLGELGKGEALAEEIGAWLRGEFTVGSECLTD